jgi:Gas vesicle synthesis protein GvpL/GvpF/Conjugal transfer protein TraD
VTPASAKYVYGVISATVEPPRGPGIGDAELELIRRDDLAALVSDIDHDEVALGREAMTTHARVLEEALGTGTVLPMRFGIVMADAAAVREELLQTHGAQLRAQLDELAGKIELKLRATYEEERLMREVVAQDPEVARLRESLRGAPEDATYYARIQLGELVAAAVERARQADTEAILGALVPLAVAFEAGEPTHERVAVNASFLVERERIAQFDDEVERIGRAQAGRMRLKYTGPLPPHSFVRLAGAEA